MLQIENFQIGAKPSVLAEIEKFQIPLKPSVLSEIEKFQICLKPSVLSEIENFQIPIKPSDFDRQAEKGRSWLTLDASERPGCGDMVGAFLPFRLKAKGAPGSRCANRACLMFSRPTSDRHG